ncbi:MAG TPA: hypothetical protein VIY70_06880 [Acidimicrobiia bacterium]
MAHSGDRCEQAGVYESACDDGTRIALMAGTRFPTCKSHGEVGWTLLESQPPKSAGAKAARDRLEPEWRTGSGERCRNTGVYESECPDQIRIALMKGSRFPNCGNHGDVEWALVKARKV